MSPGEEPAPHPSLRPLDQPGPQRVGFDVAADGQEVGVILHREALEPPLIQVAAAARVVVLVMPPYMRHADPASMALAVRGMTGAVPPPVINAKNQ